MAWPATGPSDPGYWIHPRCAGDHRQCRRRSRFAGHPDRHLGNPSWHVPIPGCARDDLNLTVNALTEDNSRGWSDLLANRWILLKDGDNSTVKAPGQADLARIADGDPLFHQLYDPVKTYTLPNADIVTLYERDGPRQPRDYPVILIETQPIADALDQWWTDGATLVFGDRDVALWVGVHDLSADRVLLPEHARGAYPVPLDELTGTIFVVSRYDNQALDQLGSEPYFAREVRSGDTRLDVFGRPTEPLEYLNPASPWDEVTVTALRGLAQVSPGQVLPLELEIENQTDRPLKLSMRLVGADGAVVAQNDVIADGSLRLGLLVPPDIPPGSYTLGAVLYDAETISDLPTRDGNAMGALTQIEINAALQSNRQP